MANPLGNTNHPALSPSPNVKLYNYVQHIAAIISSRSSKIIEDYIMTRAMILIDLFTRSIY